MTEQRENRRRTVLTALEPGEVRHGIVSSVRDFGVFVDIGGLDGMVSAANLTWAHFDHFSEVAHVGQSVTVVVLDIDSDRERVSLSLKDLEPDPLVAFARSRLGEEISGIVDGIIPPGVVVRLEAGVHGLVPADEPGLARLAADDRGCAVGDVVTVGVCGINLRRRRVRLRIVEVAH